MARVGKSSEVYGVFDAFEITPSNSGVIAGGPTRGIYVGVAGDVACLLSSDATVTMVGLAAGMWHPIQVQQILATGTTATDILGAR